MAYIKATINTVELRTVPRETNDCTVRALAAAAQIHQFDIMGFCCDVNAPHAVLGEIDCTI